MTLNNYLKIKIPKSPLEKFLDSIENNPIEYDEDGIHRCESRICGKNWKTI